LKKGPFDVYQSFVAIKLHFTSKDFDCTKFGFSLKSTTREAYLKRYDKRFFAMLDRKFSSLLEIREFFICNFAYSTKKEYITDFVEEDSFDNYLSKFLKRKESFRYIFESDMQTLRDIMLMRDLTSMSQLFYKIEPKTNFPYIINVVKQNKITLESFLILNQVLTFLPKINKIVNTETASLTQKIWEAQYIRFEKYQRLVLPIFIHGNRLTLKSDIHHVIQNKLLNLQKKQR
jgi:hypothetical protein